jgi:hypothetical protein
MSTTKEITILYRIRVLYRCMAAASEEARRREVRYCKTCKANKEIVSVEKEPDNKQQMTLECGHSLGKIAKSVIE